MVPIRAKGVLPSIHWYHVVWYPVKCKVHTVL